MTEDQNQENLGSQEGQAPQSEQPQQPPVVPQQPQQAAQGQSQPQQPVQPQGQAYQPVQPQYQSQTQYQGQPNYGQQPNYGGLDPQTKPNNYMAMNIVATIVGFVTCGACCISGILGIVAIVFSSQVTSKFDSGDLNGANSSAQTAKIIGIVSLVLTGLTLIYNIIQIAIIFSAGGMEAIMQQYMDALEQIQ